MGTAFLLLGQVEVRLDDRVIDVGHFRQRAVLLALLVDANRSVSTDQLIDRVWGQRPPQRARGTLYGYLSRLRKSLKDASDVDIRHHADGYVLAVADTSIDLRQFERLAVAAAVEHDDEQALALCERALALWRGEAFAGWDAPWSNAIRDNLQRQRRTVELRRNDIALRLGRHNDLLPELAAATTARPLDERLAGQYMLALHRGGQQAEALQHYHQTRVRLAREFGVDPSRALQDVFQRILATDPSRESALPDRRRDRQDSVPSQNPVADELALAPPCAVAPGPSGPGDPSSAAVAPASPPDPSDPQIAWCTLPRDSATFIGRAPEVDLVAGSLAAGGAGGPVAVYAIDGMPGVGKTALAIHLGHRLASQFPDRQLFIDLHAHTAGHEPVAPMEALAALLVADGFPAHRLPAGLDQRAALWRGRLAGKRALLVLDNVLDSEQVRHLLPGTAGSLVLITSRRRLADLDATSIPLDMLPAGEAAEMFGRLARRGGEEPDAVARLVDLCGRLPLAISLLAAVLAKHPSWRVDHLIHEARTRMLSVRAEQRSVAAAFDLSYRHLPAPLQRFFRRLGAYPGIEIDPYTAAALDDTTVDQATEQLDALCHDHLLTEGAYRRFHLHDLIREYANSLAAGDGDQEQALDRAYGYLAGVAAIADRRISRYPRPRSRSIGPVGSTDTSSAPELVRSDQAMAWLRAEWPNLLSLLRHANRRAQHERVVALAAGLASLLRVDGPWRQAQAVAAMAAVAARRLDDRRALADALVDRGIGEQLLDDYSAARATLEEALTHYQALGDEVGEANAYLHLAEVADLATDYPHALRLVREAHSRFRRLGNTLGAAAALVTIGSAHRALGDYGRAAEALHEALLGYRELDNDLGEASVLIHLGPVREQRGDLSGAAQALRRALAISRRVGSRLGENGALHNLGPILQRQGDLTGAAEVLSRCVRMSREMGDDAGQANALNYLASVRCDMGELAGARELLDTSLPMLRQIGDRLGETEALNQLGTLHRLSGDALTGAELHQQALQLARRMHSRWYEAHSLAGLGRCAIARGSTTEGTDLLGQALATFQSIGAGEASDISTELAAARGLDPSSPSSVRART
ncbi:AfsR/SARP family transcriptional regulator [Micromonospora costi]|uniref:OmpR/PhoB-type domain-containing protein n=1 Tax=Micromonospora costi TaxID=1530042 RepID=A0A3B0A6P8_9ACTN|nr:AfsR/SARP family transcriptional regulator [Micromonospora costi]RKN55267.1 hypothetical protein D7193_11225 [Micromonospora costi]